MLNMLNKMLKLFLNFILFQGFINKTFDNFENMIEYAKQQAQKLVSLD